MTDPALWGGNDVAARFQRARLRARLTQEQLAELSGVSVRTIRNVESGLRQTRRGSLAALAGVLGLDPDPTPRLDAPWQLPVDAPGFTGRDASRRQLDTLLDAESGQIAIIHGTGGVGKTALAVHWAHSARDAFPDGHLYANLRGFDPVGSPAPPEGVLRGFLHALYVPPPRIPVSLDELAALFRTTVEGRQMLVVLDNARNVQQVQPLLPGGPGVVVIVTSRAPLTTLVAATNARAVHLDVFNSNEAMGLLISRLGETCVERASSSSVRTIIERCAGLPLALAVVAARVALRPGLALDATAIELAAGSDPLEVLHRWDSDTDLRAVFSWSYRELSSDAAHLFRLLGQHFGPDIGLPAAASLAGLGADRTRTLLAELTAASLLTENTNSRFAMHDLLRAYARHLSPGTDADTRMAMLRDLDHYVQTAYQAAMLVNPGRHTIELDAPAPGVIVQDLTDRSEALDWFAAELPALVDGVHFAADHRFDQASWRLAWAIVDFLERHGRWHEWVTAQETALRAAQRLPGRSPRAHTHYGLALVYGASRDFDTAHAHLDQSITLFEEDGDGAREARSRVARAWLFERQGRNQDALTAAGHTLQVMRERGDKRGLGTALNGVGWGLVLIGDYHGAVGLCAEAVTVERVAGTPVGVANALDSLGYAHLGLGQFNEAIQHFEQAIATYRDIGNRYAEVLATAHLGDALAARGDHDAARIYWQIALTAFSDIDPPEAEAIQAKLDALTSP